MISSTRLRSREATGRHIRLLMARAYRSRTLSSARADYHIQAIREELLREFTDEQKEKVWTECTEAVKTSYDQLLGRWKEEMDTLLVYVS